MTPRQDPVPRTPTVGDTVTIVHRVAVPADALVHPRAPLDSLLATLVGPPAVQREGDSVRIAYTVAVWSPGRTPLTIPGAVILHPDGQVDTLPDARVTLDVASVLPQGVVVESLVPRQARPWVARAERSLLPFAVLFVPLLLGLAAAALWWRRRGPTVQPPGTPPPSRAWRRERIVAWRAAGEHALAVDHLAALLPEGPDADAWCAAVAAIRFRADAGEALAGLLDDGLALLGAGEAEG